jgi:PKD repeat protein
MFRYCRIYIFTQIIILCSFWSISFGQSLPPNITLHLMADSVILGTGQNVTQWKDLSINNYQVLQSNVGNQPILTPSIVTLNNKPVISFDGSDDYFYINANVTLGTVFIVSRWVGPETNFPDNSGLISCSNSPYSWLNGIAGSTLLRDQQFDLQVDRNGVFTSSRDYGPLADFNIITTYKSPLSYPHIIIGNSEGILSRSWKGDIAEIIAYSTILSTAELRQVEQYLNNKYAPPVVLPSNIVIANSLCDTIITSQGHFINYLWSSGATGSTTSTISVNQSGKYWVNATNIFGQISSDTIFVSYPGNLSIQNVKICQNSSLEWNTSLPKNQYNFQWQDNSTDSVFTITQAGNYYVNITDQFGCSITTDTAHISIDNFSTTATLGPDLSLCSGNLITLTSGASATNSYTWNTGSTNDSLLITNTGQYSVIATNTNNCVAKDTINVTIVGQAPTASFLNSVGCLNQTVNYTDFSVPPSGNIITSWFWNYGDGTTLSDTSHLQNPFYTYNDTGFYNINLTVETNVGCKQTETKTIHVAPTPTANFSFPSVACQNDSIAFTNQSTNVSGYSISNNNWNFGDIVSGSANISSFTSPKHVFSNNQNYTVKLVTTNSAGCKDSIYQVVQVKAEVKANFNTLQSCTNAPTIFQNTSIGPISSTYQWNFGNSFSNVLNPTKLFTNSGVQSVTLSVDGNNGCTSTITKLINVYLPPISDFVVPNFCSKDTIFITNNTIAQSGILSNNSWRLNGNNYSSTINPSVTLSNAGTYTLSLTAQNSFGCKDSVSKLFTVYPLPNVDYTTNPTTYYYIDSTVFFNPTINNASLYSWSIPSVLTSTIQNANATFTNAGTYSVTLNLTDINGCSGSKSKTIFVANRLLDLAVLDVKTLKDNFGYVTVIADLVNYGTVPVYSMNIHYTTSDAGNNKETWNGIIYPNSIYTYTFTSKSASKQNEENNITCVEIETVNSVIDDNTQNNYSCNALNIDGISVSNPLPNPTDGDIILPIILNKEINYNIKIFSSTGQLLLDETKNGLEGLNFITLPTSSFARGSYIIKTLIADKQFIKKFIKINQ